MTRRKFAIVTLLVALGCLIKFAVADSFPARLMFWFAFWLAFFHGILLFRQFTTDKQIRAIDYPYLLIGALGVLLAVLQGQEERDRYANELAQVAMPST